MKAAEEQPLID